jgi:O-antigen ligase
MPKTPIANGGAVPGAVKGLERAMFVFLALFALALPFSIKGAERAWKIALVLWLIKLLVERARPVWQPLTAPLLAFVSLSAISTVLSPEPYLSWDRMKIVGLVLVGIVVAQNIKRLSQARWLVGLLVFSAFMAALLTGWQYLYGIGVRVQQLSPSSRLVAMGMRTDSIVTSIGGRAVHSPEQMQRVLAEAVSEKRVSVWYIPYLGTSKEVVVATPRDFVQSGIGTPQMLLSRGRPYRAQGTLGHYVVFAEMLMQVGCLAWALLLTTGRGKPLLILGLAVVFLSITGALLATETRAAVAGLAIGCLLSLLLVSKGKRRWLAIAGILVILAGATVWIQRSRGLHWVDRNDVGTQFRVLMWEDGVRLICQHPWFGVGMETARVHWLEWNIRGFIQYHVQSHFHSTYLQIAVERGIPALLAWLWFCVAYVIFLTRLCLRLRHQNRIALAIATGVLAGFVAFAFTSFVHYNLGEEPLVMLLFFSMGMAIALDRMTLEPAPLGD